MPDRPNEQSRRLSISCLSVHEFTRTLEYTARKLNRLVWCIACISTKSLAPSRAMKRSALLSACCFAFLSSPLPTTTMAMSAQRRVAILGSGISGSTAARKLAERGLSVTVFECGYGVGGRTSTRTTRDEHKFAFDHGAQYIGQPKTDSFKQALNGWLEDGFVKEWKGRIASVDAANDVKEDDGDKRRYVGYPAMNSICKHLLDHDNINIVCQTRACASYNDDNDGGGCWTLTSHGDRKELGQYDWLIGGDRLSATNNRADLRDAPLSDFKDQVQHVASVPILVLMVALESSLARIPYDGITFDEDCGEFGSLGWIARDTSKPGRERADGSECWVVQSEPKAAERILSSFDDEKSFETKREMVRKKAKEILLKDFTSAIQKLSKTDDGARIPRFVSAVGHRWSAAFPSVDEVANLGKECYVDIDHNFVACGDYMGSLTGRVEGAYLSGVAAADFVLDAEK